MELNTILLIVWIFICLIILILSIISLYAVKRLSPIHSEDSQDSEVVDNFSSGTVAAPGLRGSSYNTTGLYWTNGPKLGVSVSGSQAVEFETGGIKLYGSTAENNDSYTPSLLGYYEETTNTNGTWTFGDKQATANYRLTRIGRQVTIFVDQIKFDAPTTKNDSFSIILSSAIPPRFRPNSVCITMGSPLVYNDGSTQEIWYASIDSAGVLSISRPLGYLKTKPTCYAFTGTWFVS